MRCAFESFSGSLRMLPRTAGFAFGRERLKATARLGIAYDFRGDRTPLGAVEELVRDLMQECAELFGFGLVTQRGMRR